MSEIEYINIKGSNRRVENNESFISSEPVKNFKSY